MASDPGKTDELEFILPTTPVPAPAPASQGRDEAWGPLNIGAIVASTPPAFSDHESDSESASDDDNNDALQGNYYEVLADDDVSEGHLN